MPAKSPPPTDNLQTKSEAYQAALDEYLACRCEWCQAYDALNRCPLRKLMHDASDAQEAAQLKVWYGV